MREFKSTGSIVRVEHDQILIKESFKKVIIKISEIDRITRMEPNSTGVCMVFMYVNKKKYAVAFQNHDIIEMNEFYALVSKDCKDVQPINTHAKLASYVVDYLGGSPELSKNGACRIDIYYDCIELHIGNSSSTIKIENIEHANFETQEEIVRRYTATRILALGVFALAFKKKKKSTEKYVTLDYIDHIDLQHSLLFGGKQTQVVHGAIYTALANSRSQSKNINIENEEVPTLPHKEVDLYDELKRMKELLDLGILTQEEFDLKKKELLQL